MYIYIYIYIYCMYKYIYIYIMLLSCHIFNADFRLLLIWIKHWLKIPFYFFMTDLISLPKIKIIIIFSVAYQREAPAS